ncbi:uncharacterized protein TNCV_935351 [Trichonephila clavipes]|nr:uncharacterized protein TNCV_935351 [Trichonephila clavipes]
MVIPLDTSVKDVFWGIKVAFPLYAALSMEAEVMVSYDSQQCCKRRHIVRTDTGHAPNMPLSLINKNVDQFLDGIESNLIFYQLLANLACAYLKGHLTRRGQDWYEVLGYALVLGQETDFVQLKQALKESFPIARNKAELEVAAVAEWYRYRTVACFVTGSSPVPLKTRRVGQRCTLNLSRAETSSRWCGVVVRRGGCQLRCRPRHLTMVQNYVVRRQKPSCS